MSDAGLYEGIGTGYATMRRPDRRIARQIDEAIGPADSVVNVGAGTGNYEPRRRCVVAVEPTWTMIEQRATDAAPAVRGLGEALPFGAGSFDVALASLTLHHWQDLESGLAEMRRVAQRQVIFMFEPDWAHRMWVCEYWPELVELASERAAPSPNDVARFVDVERVDVVAIPSDCTDGFAGAFWQRPERYLDSQVRASISCCAQLDRSVEQTGVDRLRTDLESGAWDERYGHLRALSEIDLGYRLVVARS